MLAIQSAKKIPVIIGLDIGKTGHHACTLDPNGKKLFDKPLV